MIEAVVLFNDSLKILIIPKGKFPGICIQPNLTSRTKCPMKTVLQSSLTFIIVSRSEKFKMVRLRKEATPLEDFVCIKGS